MSAEYRVRAHYTESTIRQSVRTLIYRRIFLRRRIFLLAVIGIVILALFQLSNADDSSGNELVFGALISALLLVPLFVIVTWRAHYQSRISNLQGMESPEVEFTLTETDMTIISSLGSTTLPWKRFTEVWELPQFWMVFLPGDQYFTIPIDTWSPEVKEFVRSKLPRATPRGWFS